MLLCIGFFIPIHPHTEGGPTHLTYQKLYGLFNLLTVGMSRRKQELNVNPTSRIYKYFFAQNGSTTIQFDGSCNCSSQPGNSIIQFYSHDNVQRMVTSHVFNATQQTAPHAARITQVLALHRTLQFDSKADLSH